MDEEIDRLLDQLLQELPDLLLDWLKRLVRDVVDVVDVDDGMTFSAAQTGAEAGVGERYLLKRVEFVVKIETPKEVSPHEFPRAPCDSP